MLILTGISGPPVDHAWVVSEKEFTEYCTFAVGAKHLVNNYWKSYVNFLPDASPLRRVLLCSEISLTQRTQLTRL